MRDALCASIAWAQVGTTFVAEKIRYRVFEENKVEVMAPHDDAVVKSYYEMAKEITIDKEVIYNGYRYEIARIGDNAFAFCKHLEKVTLPEGLMSIGHYAFSNCDEFSSP